MMRPTSACTTARCSVPRGLDWTTAVSSVSFIFLLPSNATRSSTGASTRCTISRSPARSIVTLSNRPVPSSAFSAASRAASSNRPSGAARKYERTVSASMRRLSCTVMAPRACALVSRGGASASVAAAGAGTSPSAATSSAPAAIGRRHRRPRAMHWLITSRLSLIRRGAIELPARGERMSELRSVAG